MSEMNEQTQAITSAAPARALNAAVAHGINMAAHQVRGTIEHAVAVGQIKSEEAGETLFWLYSYARENNLSRRDLEGLMRAKIGEKNTPSENTIYQIFRGSYMAADWSGVISAIEKFRDVVEEETKRKDVGFIQTETAKLIWTACLAALNDGMPAFIYGASQLGKTTALLEFQRQHNHGRTKYLRLGSRWTKARLVRELALMLGNSVREKKQWALEDAIFGGLSKYNLLIIDEFHLALETTTEYAAKEMIECLREIYDRTGCGLVLASTKVGLEGLECGKNKMLFDQLRRRGVVKVVLPDVPKVKDINAIARSFDLPVPAGEVLAGIKTLLKTRGLGVFVKYLQKAYALAREDKKPLTWEIYADVSNGYAALAALKNDY